MPLTPSRRSAISSFKVMDVVAAAEKLEREDGRKIYHLEVGQPQSAAPKQALACARENLVTDRMGYTAARGEVPLREALARMYKRSYGVDASPARIHVTPGSSGAFSLAFLAAFDVGDVVAVASAGYPCYRNLLTALGCVVVTLPVDARYRVTATALGAAQAARAERHEPPIKGLILSSPGNPTGAVLDPEELKALCELCDASDVQFISDEIYHGIEYEGAPRAACALEYTKSAIIINSFSKYYSMTGWRLGWLVVPDHLDANMNALNANMNVSAPTIAQRAAVAALSDEAAPELKSHIARYAVNRTIVLDGLRAMGITTLAPAEGAFYAYADLSAHGVTDSAALCAAALTEAGVAIVPGIDFEEPGSGLGECRIRISYPGATEDVREAMRLLGEWWAGASSALALRGGKPLA